MTVRRALLAVYDKTGVVELARGLSELGVALVSSGGTAAQPPAAGLPGTAAAGGAGAAWPGPAATGACRCRPGARSPPRRSLTPRHTTQQSRRGSRARV